jgi:hypothetical protein
MGPAGGAVPAFGRRNLTSNFAKRNSCYTLGGDGRANHNNSFRVLSLCFNESIQHMFDNRGDDFRPVQSAEREMLPVLFNQFRAGIWLRAIHPPICFIR